MLSTLAMVTWISRMPSTNQVPKEAKVLAKQWMSVICERAMTAHARATADTRIPLADDLTLIVRPNGSIWGWLNVVSRLNPTLQEHWRLIVAYYAFDTIDVKVVVNFLVSSWRIKIASQRSRVILERLLDNLIVDFLTPWLTTYIFDVWGASHDMFLPPSILRSAHNRLIGGMDPESAWSVLERARLVGKTSERTIIGVKNDEAHLKGLSVYNASVWATKELSMYITDNRRLFCKVCKIGMIADPSTYAGEETMVAIIYSFEIRAGCYAPVQVIPQGADLCPDDFEMPDDVAARAYARKLQRVHALREWQAISSACWHVTDLSIDDFDLPDGVYIGRLKENERRVGDNVLFVYVVFLLHY